MPWLAAVVGIDAVMGLVGAKMKSDAAKQAATIQQQAAQKAQAINQGVYQQNMALMQPFAASGPAAANTLSRLYMSPGQPYTPDLQAQDAQRFYNQPPAWSLTPGGQWSAATGGSAGPMTGPSPTTALASMASVPMRAPDGSVRNVPQAQVQNYLNKGAALV